MKHEFDIGCDEGTSLALDQPEIERIGTVVLDQQGVKRPCFVSLSVVTDKHMQRLNHEWRQVDAPTDVLSLECERPDDPDLGEGEPCELGDIVLAPAYIERQARRFYTTPEDETRLLFVHGMLHLLGYDHIQEADAHRMQACEDVLLAQLPTDHTLSHVVLARHREDA